MKTSTLIKGLSFFAIATAGALKEVNAKYAPAINVCNEFDKYSDNKIGIVGDISDLLVLSPSGCLEMSTNLCGKSLMNSASSGDLYCTLELVQYRKTALLGEIRLSQGGNVTWSGDNYDSRTCQSVLNGLPTFTVKPLNSTECNNEDPSNNTVLINEDAETNNPTRPTLGR